MGNIEKVVTEALGIANNNAHGYAQDNRYAPDFDCSSLIAECLRRGGYQVSKYLNTTSLPVALEKIGWVKIADINDRKRGDIIGRSRKHVVMLIDKDNIVHASINENGGIKNGKVGDQTGREICTRDFYIPNYSWEYHYRCPENLIVEEEVIDKVDTEPEVTFEYYTVQRGDTLWSIAQKVYGKGIEYTKLIKLNGLTSTVIVTNQKLKIKEAEPVVKKEYAEMHTVKTGESLWKIATNYLGKGTRYKEIMELNKLTSTVINVGTKLKIPFK